MINTQPQATVSQDGLLKRAARSRARPWGISCTCGGGGYLFRELHHLLDVVIVDSTSALGLMTASRREAELRTLVTLLFKVQQQVPTSLQHDLGAMAHQGLAFPASFHS